MSKYISIAILFMGFISQTGYGQDGLTKGSRVENIPVKKVLNSSAPMASLADVKKELTIIDFFGTWCVPCLRALPHLKEIREQFASDVNIILVSNEKEAQLQKFIKARNSFSFPVVVDEDNTWNNLFQPPSLPYTVVVKEGKVIAITEAEAITSETVKQWLQQTNSDKEGIKEVAKQTETKPMSGIQKHSNPVIQLSQDYIYAAKVGDSISELNAQLKNLDYQTLKTALTNDALKKAFWINVYNGYTQVALKSNPDQYKNRNAFFKKKAIEVAGKFYSLDEIEHGILRRSKIKWSLGHFSKLFPSKREKELRVDKVDYRLHFALNCGAKSCPPIAFYNPDNLDKQLDLATQAYLSGEATYDSRTNILRLPKLMSWFRADFGGKRGMIRIAKRLKIVPENVKPKIKFNYYDWSLTLNQYKNYE